MTVLTWSSFKHSALFSNPPPPLLNMLFFSLKGTYGSRPASRIGRFVRWLAGSIASNFTNHQNLIAFLVFSSHKGLRRGLCEQERVPQWGSEVEWRPGSGRLLVRFPQLGHLHASVTLLFFSHLVLKPGSKLLAAFFSTERSQIWTLWVRVPKDSR